MFRFTLLQSQSVDGIACNGIGVNDHQIERFHLVAGNVHREHTSVGIGAFTDILLERSPTKYLQDESVHWFSRYILMECMHENILDFLLSLVLLWTLPAQWQRYVPLHFNTNSDAK